MTYAEKNEIMLKDLLSIEDVRKLTGLCYSTAVDLMRKIRIKYPDAFRIQGYVATTSYLQYINGGIKPCEITTSKTICSEEKTPRTVCLAREQYADALSAEK